MCVQLACIWTDVDDRIRVARPSKSLAFEDNHCATEWMDGAGCGFVNSVAASTLAASLLAQVIVDRWLAGLAQ